MLERIISLLIMLNPFALFLYLNPIMKELSTKSFHKVLFKASLISLFILLVFALGGNIIFNEILNIDFEAFRIFGGIIIFSYAYIFIIKGQKALIHLKEDLDDLASEIALPFMVGAGTISIAVLMGSELNTINSALGLISVFSINFLIIVGLQTFRNSLRLKKLKIAFDKNMEVLLRLTGFLVGSIGINMIVQGLRGLGFI